MEQSAALEIQHAEEGGRGAFFIVKDGTRIAEMTYKRLGAQLVNINHTEVDQQLQGMGIARKLLDRAVAWARATHTKVTATCPYAKAQFAKDPSIGDVYQP